MENFYAENTGDDALAYFNVKVLYVKIWTKKTSFWGGRQNKQTFPNYLVKETNETGSYIADLLLAYVNVELYWKAVGKMSLDMLVYVLR